MKKILGISAFYHDSAAALIVDGKVIAAAQEERFTRKKHTAVFPMQAVKYCLDEGGLEINELDAVVFYDKPLLKFERLLQTYYSFAPKGLFSFLKAMPVWLHEKIFLKKQIYQGLRAVGHYDKKSIKLLFSEHHLSHAASAFYASPFKQSAILTIDGVGEWCTASIGMGSENNITLLQEMKFPHSVGLLYSAFTYFLGFKVNSGEYKLMGLAPYGNTEDEETLKFIKIIKSELVDIKDDGSIWLNQQYFRYATGLKMLKDEKWEKLFGFSRREEKDEIQQHHTNLAFAIQEVTEEIVLKMAHTAKKETGSHFLCLAGGVALNCVANGRLQKSKLFKDIYIQPAAGDAGGALGAAWAVHFMYFNEKRHLAPHESDQMQGAYLGPEFTDKEIRQMNLKVKANAHRIDNFAILTEKVAEKLQEGKIVGWFQGRMEFGPRALGNRSILAHPGKEEMQQKLNLKIKYREGFRPFAPSVLHEEMQAYFDFLLDSPYMLYTASIAEEKRKSLPGYFNSLSLQQKLQVKRSDIPAVTHIDFSARLQTVHKKTNPKYWQLIDAFRKKTGIPLLVNTSFNVRGEPMVCTPYDAYRCFMATDMDYLVIGHFLYDKTSQPDWENKEKWGMKLNKD